VRQTSTALQTYCRDRCTDGPFESTARSYFSATESLEASWVHSASVCTRHGDEFRIANNGNEPWKRLCSNRGPVLNDDAIRATVMLNVRVSAERPRTVLRCATCCMTHTKNTKRRNKRTVVVSITTKINNEFVMYLLLFRLLMLSDLFQDQLCLCYNNEMPEPDT